jgi:hypothetical protein
MFSVRRARLLPVAVALAVTAAVLATVVTARRSDAYVPMPELARAVESYRNSLGWPEGSDYFLHPDGMYGDNGPDGLPGPDGTPDGRGAFHFYRGTRGDGAVYSQLIPAPVLSSTGATIRSGTVYGDIGASWSASGYEDGPFGYPSGRERGLMNSDLARNCRGDRVQLFEKLVVPFQPRGLKYSLACWTRATGTVTWSSWWLGQ